MKAVLLFFALIFAPFSREGISLDGEWPAIMDQYDKGIDKKMFTDAKPAGKTSFVEFSYEGGLRLKVPGDWNHQDASLWWYEGTIWYSKHFMATKQAGRRTVLYFSGVSQRCEVYLNGEYVTEHEGAFTPFEADITELIQEGDNFIAVRVDNKRSKEAIPAMSFDWWNYGGITRNVMLLDVPEVYVKDAFLRLDDHSHETIKVDIELSEKTEGVPVIVSLPELKVKITLYTDSSGRVSGCIKARKLSLWSPETPVLYDITIEAGEDRVSERIGFRDITVEGTKIILNGKPFFFKGISFHEEIPMERRRACSPEDAHVLVDAAIGLGCNAIRLAHYPQNEYIVRYAEEKGLLIWEEIPLWQGIDFSNEETYRKAETYLNEMITRDKNRCSIGFWSISNETRPAPDRDAFLSQLLAYGRSLDHSRLFASAFDVAYYIPEVDEFRMEDAFAGELDVIGINKYMGWYASWPKPASELKWNVFMDKPLIISEFGCEAKAGVTGHSDVASSWSEDYQEALYRDNLTMFENIPNLAGVSPWILFDFLSPYRQHPVNQGWFNRKGLISDKGEKKKAWYVMNEYYKNN